MPGPEDRRKVNCEKCGRRADKARFSAPMENICELCWPEHDYQVALRKGRFGGRHMNRLMRDMSRGKVPVPGRHR